MQALVFLLVSEDRSDGALDVLESISKGLMREVCAGCSTAPSRMRFDPVEGQARKAAIANRMASRKEGSRQERVTLTRAIATGLATPRGFVVYHMDGDVVWAKRKKSAAPDRLEEWVKQPVRQLLAAKKGNPAALLAKLLFVCPFYSIESWLYQNGRVAKQLCSAKCGGMHVRRIDSWETDRGLLDEVDRPKEAICLGDEYNARLAREAFPFGEVIGAGKSLAATRDRFAGCNELVEGLKDTRDQVPSGSGARRGPR